MRPVELSEEFAVALAELLEVVSGRYNPEAVKQLAAMAANALDADIEHARAEDPPAEADQNCVNCRHRALSFWELPCSTCSRAEGAKTVCQWEAARDEVATPPAEAPAPTDEGECPHWQDGTCLIESADPALKSSNDTVECLFAVRDGTYCSIRALRAEADALRGQLTQYEEALSAVAAEADALTERNKRQTVMLEALERDARETIAELTAALAEATLQRDEAQAQLRHCLPLPSCWDQAWANRVAGTLVLLADQHGARDLYHAAKKLATSIAAGVLAGEGVWVKEQQVREAFKVSICHLTLDGASETAIYLKAADLGIPPAWLTPEVPDATT